MSWIFKCMQCGNCCRNLSTSGEFGLMIFPEEMHLFPDEKLEPCLAKGKSPKHSSFVLYTLQLRDNICPHLDENLCRIYENRPLACRKYPFQVKYLIGDDALMEVNPDCTAYKNALQKGEFKENMRIEETSETYYAKVVARWISFKEQKSRKDAQWVYNMKSREWEPFKSKWSRVGS